MVPLIKQVMKQTRARIPRDTRAEGKILTCRAVDRNHPQGQGGKPNEFGKMVKLQEAKTDCDRL